MTTYYKQGDWNAICALCGTKYKASQLRWNSQIQDWVCIYDWEQIHPQQRIRGVQDDQSVAWVRPDPEPVYTNEPYVALSNTDPVYPFYYEYGYCLP